MSDYDDRPWLGAYNNQPADYELEYNDGLDHVQGRPRRRPDRAAIKYFDGVITRRELDEISDALACGLLANGFEAGDRLAVYLQNVPQFVIGLLAAWKAGGMMVSINPMCRARELTYLLKDSGRHGAGLPRGAVRRRRPRGRPRTPTSSSCSRPASWSTRPATTSGCSRASSGSATRAPPTSPD